MKPTDVAHELLFPLRDSTLLVALVSFYLLAKLVVAAGLLGLWLAVVVVPAFVRYLLGVCEARIYGRAIEVAGIEKFNYLASPAALMALFWLLLCAWPIVHVGVRYGGGMAAVCGLMALVVVPAPLAMLALSRSPLASINPAALLSLLQVTGLPYVLIPSVLTAVLVLAFAASLLGAPRVVGELCLVYVGFLLFTFTGAIVGRSNAVSLIQTPTPEEADPETVLERLDQERSAVLNHAYGLISRGNRAGGFKHLANYLDATDFPLEDAGWFFEAMLRWESKEPALFFAQPYLTRLLDHNQTIMALKVLTRCGLEDEQFRPAAEDRERLAALVEAHDRADLRMLVR